MMTRPPLHRALSALLVLVLVASIAGLSGCAGDRADGRPRAVVLIIADGMGASQVTFARALRGKPPRRFTWEEFPVVGLMSTWSASNWVTDSGAAATALASGVKTTNQRVGMDPDGRPLRTIADVAKEQGWKVGYVTDTEITHATPAAFYAAVEDRYLDVDQIAAQLLEQEPDVALGGGRSQFVGLRQFGDRLDGADLLAEAEAAGYTVWDWSSDRTATPPDRLLGVFAGGHIPFLLDGRFLPEPQRPPTLAELTDIALEVLGRGDGRFFLMLEGGRIDHAGHDFDAAGVAAQVEELDRAVARVVEYRKAHPETLVLLTADHPTGGLAINDFVAWDAFGDQVGSLERIATRIQDQEEPMTLDELRAATGMAGLTAEDLEAARTASDKYEARRVIGTRLSDRNGVTWVPRIDPWDTKGHTGEDVPLYAVGPGAEVFGGTLDNAEVPLILVDLLGWPAPNPAVTPPAAVAAAGSAAHPEDRPETAPPPPG